MLVEFGVVGSESGPMVGSTIFVGPELGRGDWRTEFGANFTAEQYVARDAPQGRVVFSAIEA